MSDTIDAPKPPKGGWLEYAITHMDIQPYGKAAIRVAARAELAELRELVDAAFLWELARPFPCECDGGCPDCEFVDAVHKYSASLTHKDQRP